MNTEIFYSIVGLLLFFFGLFALIACSQPLRKILGVNVMSTGVFLFLIATAYGSGPEVVDPVPQAMVLTGIVVAICTTSLALILACRVQETSNLSQLFSRRQNKSGREPGGQ